MKTEYVPFPVSTAQSAFYLITAIWPFVSQASFEAVTGPKTDRWLVKTVAVLVGVIGLTLAIPGGRRHKQILGATSALGLAGIDMYYALNGRISKIYLADAFVELILVGLWTRHTLLCSSTSPQHSTS